jgi:hypothetical protein
MKKPTMAPIETTQKPPHALTPAPSSCMNGASNSINKLKLNQEPNNFGTKFIPIPIVTLTMQPNSKEPTTITPNATWLWEVCNP